MSELGEAWITRHTNYFSDPNAGADELLNDATEWLHHAHCTLKLITELADEWRSVDVQRLAIVLQGLAGFVEMGMRCAAQAHMRMQLAHICEENECLVGTE